MIHLSRFQQLFVLVNLLNCYTLIFIQIQQRFDYSAQNWIGGEFYSLYSLLQSFLINHFLGIQVRRRHKAAQLKQNHSKRKHCGLQSSLKCSLAVPEAILRVMVPSFPFTAFKTQTKVIREKIISMIFISFAENVHRSNFQKLSSILPIKKKKIANLPKETNHFFFSKLLLIFNLHFNNVLQRIAVNASGIIENAQIKHSFLIFTGRDKAHFCQITHEITMNSFGNASHFVTDKVLVCVIELLHNVNFLEFVIIKMEGTWTTGDKISALPQQSFMDKDFMNILLVYDKLDWVSHYKLSQLQILRGIIHLLYGIYSNCKFQTFFFYFLAYSGSQNFEKI